MRMRLRLAHVAAEAKLGDAMLLEGGLRFAEADGVAPPRHSGSRAWTSSASQ